jgi:hypothetical protein
MVATLSTEIKEVIYNVSGNLYTYSIPSWYMPAVTTFFFLSLAVNALVTALIVYRIITLYNDIRGFGTNSSQGSLLGHRDLNPLISILIESSLITFIAQLIQTVMYKAAIDAFPLISGSVVMLYVRASC